MWMSYQLHESQGAAWSPFLPWLEATASFVATCGDAPAMLPVRLMGGWCDLLVRLGKRYPKPKFGLTETVIDGETVAVTETIALEKPFCRLLHFERASCQKHPVALVVPPLSGHHATLLRDTVRAMLPDFDVYIADWTDARMVPLFNGAFHMDDYVAYVREFIGFLGSNVHVLAVCQSTVPVLAAISLAAADGEPTPTSMTLIGGPIDARRGPTTVDEFALSKPLDWFERELIDTVPGNYSGAGRKVYPGFLQRAAFIAMNPERHLNSHWGYLCDMLTTNADGAEAHRRFYDEYNAVFDMPAEYYLETIRIVFQEFRLACGTWQVRGESVRPHHIAGTALITVEGERDDICGAGQTHAAHDLCTGIAASRKHRLTAAGCGHYGIFSGSVWRTEIYPRLRDLLYESHSTAIAF